MEKAKNVKSGCTPSTATSNDAAHALDCPCGDLKREPVHIWKNAEKYKCEVQW